MIAVLAMYDWPGIRAETDAFWGEVARRLAKAGIEAPAALSRPGDVRTPWRDPELLIGQTCGMPFVCGDCGSARVIARGDYGLPEAQEGCYRSVIVVRAEDAGGQGREAVLAQAGRRAAVNEWRSYSGHIALRAHLADLRDGAAEPFFGAAVLSGAHIYSARMVARGEADVASLDGVAWAMLKAQEPETAGRLAVIGATAPAPALPFITARRFAGRRAQLAAALAGAAAAMPAVAGLPRSITPADESDYAAVRAAARRAAREAFAPDAPAVPPL